LKGAGDVGLALLPSGRVLLMDGPELRLLQVVVGGGVVDLGIVDTLDPNYAYPKLAPTIDGGAFNASSNAGPNTVSVTACIVYDALPPTDAWRPVLDMPTPNQLGYGGTFTLSGSNLFGLVEPSDHPTSAGSHHPVAVFMPFGGPPTVGGFHDWTETSVQYTPQLAKGGIGYLFASVAGQLGGTSVVFLPLPAGSACGTNNDCDSGICVDDVCCDGVCGFCEACSAAAKVDGIDGTCGPALPDSDPRGDCEADDVLICQKNGECDGAGQCALYADGTQCADGKYCIAQSCDEGCASDQDCKDGFACLDQTCLDHCSSNLHCQDGFVCGPDGSCVPPFEPAVAIGCAPCTTGGGGREDSAAWWLIAASVWAWRRRREKSNIMKRSLASAHLVAAALVVAGSGCIGKVTVFSDPGTGGSAAGSGDVGGTGGGDGGGAPGCGDASSEPVVYFPFNTCSATSPEASGTGLYAALQNGSCDASDALSMSLGTSWSSGTALSCDGQGLCAEAPDDVLFEPAQFTLSAWIYSDDFAFCSGGSGLTCSIMSKANTDNSSNGYWLMVFENSLRMTLAGEGNETDVMGVSTLSTSTWHHVVATFDGSTAALYLNGMLDASQPIDHNVPYGSESFLIGSMTNRLFDFYGNIDEVAIRNYAMTAAEVKELRDAYFDCP
jgi:hypothetical protein